MHSTAASTVSVRRDERAARRSRRAHSRASAPRRQVIAATFWLPRDERSVSPGLGSRPSSNAANPAESISPARRSPAVRGARPAAPCLASAGVVVVPAVGDLHVVPVLPGGRSRLALSPSHDGGSGSDALAERGRGDHCSFLALAGGAAAERPSGLRAGTAVIRHGRVAGGRWDGALRREALADRAWSGAGPMEPSSSQRRDQALLSGRRHHAVRSPRTLEHGRRLRAVRALAARGVRGDPPVCAGRRAAVCGRAGAPRGRSRRRRRGQLARPDPRSRGAARRPAADLRARRSSDERVGRRRASTCATPSAKRRTGRGSS